MILGEVWVMRWAPQKGDPLDIHGVLTDVWEEDFHPSIWICQGRLVAASQCPNHTILCPLCWLPQHGEYNGSTPTSAAM